MSAWDDRDAIDAASASASADPADLQSDAVSDDPVAADPEVESLIGGIEATREEMTVTVEEIGDRLDPKTIVASAKETVRDATVGKVEDMANSASEMVSNAGETAREAGSGIVDTIMRNPVPAAMVGIGLGWLAMSGRSSSKSRSWSGDGGRWAASGQTRFGAGYGGDYGTDYGSSRSGSGGYDTRADQAAGDPMRRVKDRASEMADQAGETVEQVKDQVGRMADEVPYRVQGTARDVGDQVGRMYDDNPLAMGAIAVAVGAAVGLALPATQMERRTIGQPARQMLEKAEETASDALGQVEQKAQDAEQQAREQDEQAKGQESRARAH